MSNHGFERIDSVLTHLAAQMDASIERRQSKTRVHIDAMRNPAQGDSAAASGPPDWMQSKTLGDLLDRMNTRFEGMVKRM